MSNNQDLKPPSAREKLQLSQLKLTQLELMGQDVDLDAFKLEMWKVMPIDIISRITDANVERTTGGASTFQVDVDDAHRDLLRSGYISKQVDVEIDGLWWRLTQFKKNGDAISLIFEEREIAVLRTYKKPIKASQATDRANITRAQFILRLLREPHEYKHHPIPYFIPDLKTVEPVGLSTTQQATDVSKNDTRRNFGIAPGETVMLKGRPANPTQIKNLNTILAVGVSHALPRPVLLMGIMCAIQESDVTNLPIGVPGDFNYLGPYPNSPVGVFQQIPKWWKSKGGATRNVGKDALAFFKSASSAYASHPEYPLWANILRAQDEPVNKSMGKDYQRWLPEAQAVLNAYGIGGGNQAQSNRQADMLSGAGVSKDYEFFRGVPPQQGQNIWRPEDSWTCITRLASEVNWRAFFVSGTFYYLDDERLFSSKPRARITEGKGGVDLIDGDYDERKKNSTLTVNCRIGRWNVPPGCVVALHDMGPMDGRWLVTDVSRSLFNDQGTITLQKPQPQLPEPLSDSGSTSLNYGKLRRGKRGGGTDPQVLMGGFVNPFPGGWIPNRLDMGWDGTFKGDKLLAPFDGTLTFASYIGGSSPWGGYVVIKAHNKVPGLPTHSLYFAEGLAAVLPAGAKVKAGDVIARAAKSPYGDPYGTHGFGQIEWGVAEDASVGQYSRPYAQRLGLGSTGAARMVKSFVSWAHTHLGINGNPTSTGNAGRP